MFRPPLVLRTGDVLEVLQSRAERYTAPHNDQALIRDYALWTQGLRFQIHLFLRLWSPAWNRPIITWLPPDTEWLPACLTFSGSFSSSFPGRWVPIPWGPSRVIQLMQASEDENQVHVLVEHHAGTYATEFAHTLSLQELAEELHTVPGSMSIVGVDCPTIRTPVRLRNGDILHDNMLMSSSQPLYGWPDDAATSDTIVSPVGIAFALRRLPCMFAFACLLHMFWMPGQAARTVSTSRSPARAVSPGRAVAVDCRLGQWRPDYVAPVSAVATGPTISFRVLCPFQGWSPVMQECRDVPEATLVQDMHDWCSIWALRPVLQGGPVEGADVCLLPGGLAPLATVVVHVPGLVFARLLPRVCTYRRLYASLRRTVAVGASRLRLPPALRVFEQHQESLLQLRDGDAFELYYEPTHLAFRSSVSLAEIPLARLPHFDGWHTPFRLASGGWVTVWDPWSPTDLCTTRWVSQGAVWSPLACCFQRHGAPPSTDRWVPTAWLEDAQCHFVRQSDPDFACVIQVPDGDSEPYICAAVRVTQHESHVPDGWRLRPDIQARSPLLQLRDGDVLIPTERTTRRRSSGVSHSSSSIVSVACSLAFGRWWPVLLLSLSLQLPSAQSMVPDDPPPPLGTVRVGRYAWRIPEALRLCDAVVDSGHQAILISPFTGRSNPSDTDPDLPIDDLCSQLTGSEPGWADGICPIWPALQPTQLHFVPVVDSPRLVVLLVVAPEWQAAYIVPRRSDLAWLLQTLRRGSDHVLCGLRPPQSAMGIDFTDSTAIDWRTGDVVLALPLTAQAGGYQAPCFHSGLDIRHSALWAFDFHVTCDLPITMWRPGLRPSRTTMPAPGYWSASMQTFAGTFSRNYPGRWVPVPWIYSDEVHLCLRASGEHECNLILEELQQGSLQGRCVTMHTWCSLPSLALQLGIAPSRLALLGHSGTQPVVSLRDGDVLHYPVCDYARGPALGKSLLYAFLLGALFGRRGTRGWVALATALLWLNRPAAAGAAPVDPPILLSTTATPVCHWIWSPYQGAVGPNAKDLPDFADQFHRAEPWWDHDLVPVSPSVAADAVHWVPRSPSTAFVVAFLLGPPAPSAMLLPQALPKRTLLQILQRQFPSAASVRGQIPQLSEHVPSSTIISMRDGDALSVRIAGWQPSIHGPATSTFPSHAQARAYGMWSHALEFHSDCWLLLWPQPGAPPIAVYATGVQRWDPGARSLRPALSHLPEAWWPSLLGSHTSSEPLHLVADAGDLADRVHVLRPHPWRCCALSAHSACLRTGDVLDGTPEVVVRFPQPATPSAQETPSRSNCLQASIGLVPGIVVPTALLSTSPNLRRFSAWSLMLLGCYLAAFGAPPSLVGHDGRGSWQMDMTATAALTAKIHEYWWTSGLRLSLPASLPLPYHHAWCGFTPWSGGVPSSLFIATGGSGRGGGSWAFAAWAYAAPRWYRVGWIAAPLSSTVWLPPQHREEVGFLASYVGELAALQAAGLWLAAQLDLWQMCMGCRPSQVTIAVDNASALLAASGHGGLSLPAATLARQAWQAVQSRTNTFFRHVHSHVGLMANSLVDALAEQSAARHPICDLPGKPPTITQRELTEVFPSLWLLPFCRMHAGTPKLRIERGEPPAESSFPITAQPPELDSLNVTSNASNTENARVRVEDAPLGQLQGWSNN